MIKDFYSRAYEFWYLVQTKEDSPFYINEILMLDNFGGGNFYFRDIKGLIYILKANFIYMMKPVNKTVLINKGLYNLQEEHCIDPIDLPINDNNKKDKV